MLQSLKWCGLLFVALTGCRAGLEVQKVPHGPDGDEIEGFRYYMSRPYVIVRDRILVSEQICLVKNLPPNVKLGTPETWSRRSPDTREISSDELLARKERLNEAGGVQPAQYVSPSDAPPFGSAFDEATAPPFVPSEVGTHLEIPTLEPKRGKDTAPLQGKIQVVFLPDLDEQYAVDNDNCLARSAYSLTFRDGWGLSDVSGEFDSTTVAIELLNTIDTAINAARDVSVSGIQREAQIAQAASGGGEGDRFDKDVVEQGIYQQITRTYIKPGVYRINKPWEVDGGPAAEQGCGLLANLGLTMYQATEYQILPARNVDISALGKPLTGEVGIK